MKRQDRKVNKNLTFEPDFLSGIHIQSLKLRPQEKSTHFPGFQYLQDKVKQDKNSHCKT